MKLNKELDAMAIKASEGIGKLMFKTDGILVIGIDGKPQSGKSYAHNILVHEGDIMNIAVFREADLKFEIIEHEVVLDGTFYEGENSAPSFEYGEGAL